ncbi:hypothetical protein MFLAVUS_000788 [Mucor flavus]|uniref:BHLH domain-containing protein n=1 Tax=Mucor flavus TaxID=439312 RepID=A0ABP9YKQ1_9FUNG
MFSKSEQDKLQAFLRDVENDEKANYSSLESEPSSSKKRNDNNKKRNNNSPYKRKSTTPEDGLVRSGRARKPAHELLSDTQKKANHIASEQKRRANIRIGFDQLVDIVPALDSCHRSESLILQKSVDYIRGLIQDKNDLKQRARELQSTLGEVPDDDSSEGEMENLF